MKNEKPILYNTEMVQAVQREINPKTQTRRTKGLEKINENPNDWVLEHNLVSQEFFFFHNDNEDLMHDIKCPFGKIGDLLWVRETSKLVQNYGVDYKIFQYKDGLFSEEWCNGKVKELFIEQSIIPETWTPSIHMPKEACRIWLEITDIKIERLQTITENGAKAEGFKDAIELDKLEKLVGLGDWEIPSPFSGYQLNFLETWCSIYGCESWLNNPWVWVITFKKVAKP